MGANGGWERGAMSVDSPDPLHLTRSFESAFTALRIRELIPLRASNPLAHLKTFRPSHQGASNQLCSFEESEEHFKRATCWRAHHLSSLAPVVQCSGLAAGFIPLDPTRTQRPWFPGSAPAPAPLHTPLPFPNKTHARRSLEAASVTVAVVDCTRRGKRELPEKTRRVPHKRMIPQDIEPGFDLRERRADKIDFKRVYTEVTFAIVSDFIRHAPDDSTLIADLQRNTNLSGHTLEDFAPIGNHCREDCPITSNQVKRENGPSLLQKPISKRRWLECTEGRGFTSMQQPMEKRDAGSNTHTTVVVSLAESTAVRDARSSPETLAWEGEDVVRGDAAVSLTPDRRGGLDQPASGPMASRRPHNESSLHPQAAGATRRGNTFRVTGFPAATRRCQSSLDMTRNETSGRSDAGMQEWGKREYPEKNPPASGIVQHDSHRRKSGSEPAGDPTRITVVGGERPSHCATAAPFNARIPPGRTRFNLRPGHSRIFASGNRAERCRWSAGFLGDFPIPPSPCVVALLHTHIISPSSALKTSIKYLRFIVVVTAPAIVIILEKNTSCFLVTVSFDISSHKNSGKCSLYRERRINASTIFGRVGCVLERGRLGPGSSVNRGPCTANGRSPCENWRVITWQRERGRSRWTSGCCGEEAGTRETSSLDVSKKRHNRVHTPPSLPPFNKYASPPKPTPRRLLIPFPAPFPTIKTPCGPSLPLDTPHSIWRAGFSHSMNLTYDGVRVSEEIWAALNIEPMMVPMMVKRGEYGAAPECKRGGNGRTTRKPADQRHRPARFPHSEILGWPRRKTGRGDVAARALTLPRLPAGSLPEFCTWESCRTMPLVGWFSREAPVSPALAFRRCSMRPHRFLIPRC
ncbi:hypothetical protein PR048_000914 [Dryococelus australis]|uniref:Uncharacterized protein n=1 Tax=Dryococelus australis TaxID=614101 RepID=A0ABQ9IFX2_9NEOP|nr:hypothetical protein PR048_000914 [Dryococelus australis]